MTLPQLTGVARLTADPELRFSASGVAVGSCQLAFNSRRKNDQGEWEDGDTFFVKATAFRQLAEHLAETLTKGTEVIVTGRMKTESWTNRDGDKRSAPALLLDSIGPSLRYATAKIHKVQRNGSGGSSGGTDDPWTAQPAVSGSYDDEPPF